MSPWNLVPHRLSPEDALPGIDASEADFFALIEALHDAIDTFQETHPDLTFGDSIHAARCVMRDLTMAYTEDTADA